MKMILLIAAICTPAISFCQGKSQLSGNWKEITRRGNNNQPVTFQDTLKLEFMAGNEYLWHKGGSFLYRGTYKIEDNNLDLGMASFKILDRDKKVLALKDDAGMTYELVPYTPPASTPAAKRQETYKPVYNISQMAGDWSVYKRTSDKTLDKVDYTRQIKKVEIFSKPKDGKWGYFYAGMDGDKLPSWFIESYADQVITLSGKDRRRFNVIKAQDGELILEENGITYFFKQF